MPHFFNLTTYLSSFKPKNIALVFGVYNFMQVFDIKYEQLDGGILEALGNLFRPNVMVYLYPYREDKDEDLIDLNSVKVPSDVTHLLEHIKSSGQVKNLSGYNEDILHIYSRKVLDMIRNSKPGWEDFVPKEISKTINEKCLFGHPCDHLQKK